MATATVNWDEISVALDEYHVPEIVLALIGVLALLIVRQYLKDKESQTYKLLVLAGVVAGAAMVYLAVSHRSGWDTATLIIAAVAAFALIIRPFRDIHFAALFGLMAGVVAYIYLGSMTGNLEVLASGWPRVVLAFVAGAIVFMLFNFLEQLVQMFGKFFNAWPILAILALICIAEAVAVALGYGSVYGLLTNGR